MVEAVVFQPCRQNIYSNVYVPVYPLGTTRIIGRRTNNDCARINSALIGNTLESSVAEICVVFSGAMDVRRALTTRNNFGTGANTVLALVASGADFAVIASLAARDM